MTTRAQVLTAYQTFQTQLDSLVSTAIDGLNPDKTTTRQIIAIANDARAKIDQVFVDAAAKLQAIGVL